MERKEQRRMTLAYWVLGTVALALIADVAIQLAIQRRDDRILAEEIDRSATELQVIGQTLLTFEMHISLTSMTTSAPMRGSSPC